MIRNRTEGSLLDIIRSFYIGSGDFNGLPFRSSESEPSIAEELIDTLYWVLLIAHDLDIDLTTAFEKKMTKNEEKYSVEKSKGNHKKYTELVD